jgi:osmotically-inducible protein OsmY
MGRATHGRGFVLAGAIGLAFAAPAHAQQPAPTPGPAATVGHAIDRAVTEVSHDVAEAMLIAKVRIALLEHLKSDALGIHIDARGKDVTLTGEVKERGSVRLAGAVAASVDGVAAVSNRVEVEVEAGGSESGVSQAMRTAEAAVQNALVEAHVKARLIAELGEVAFSIEVEAESGVVSLSGTVPDAARRDLAQKIARGTRGVRELHDLLRVRER